MRDSTGARIIFPTPQDKDQELITVIGTEEAVAEAQKVLEALIKSLVGSLFSFSNIPKITEDVWTMFPFKCFRITW